MTAPRSGLQVDPYRQDPRERNAIQDNLDRWDCGLDRRLNGVWRSRAHDKTAWGMPSGRGIRHVLFF